MYVRNTIFQKMNTKIVDKYICVCMLCIFNIKFSISYVYIVYTPIRFYGLVFPLYITNVRSIFLPFSGLFCLLFFILYYFFALNQKYKKKQRKTVVNKLNSIFKICTYILFAHASSIIYALYILVCGNCNSIKYNLVWYISKYIGQSYKVENYVI